MSSGRTTNLPSNVIETLKSLLRDQLGIPPVMVLITVGLLAHLSVNLLLKKPIAAASGLAGPLALGIALESYEIWEQYHEHGLFAEGNEPFGTIVMRHLGDVAWLMLIPAVLVSLDRFRSVF